MSSSSSSFSSHTVAVPAGSSSSVSNQNSSSSSGSNTYMLNSKIMVVAVAVLFGVVLFILCIHIYAKWFWRNHTAIVRGRGAHSASFPWRTRRRRRRRGQMNFLRGRGRGEGYNQDDDSNNFPPYLLDGFGLDKTALELLPTFVYTAAEMKSTVLLECAVCLEEFEEKERGRLLPRCNHCFHLDCIDMWFLSHSTCPLCRTSVKFDEKPQDGLDSHPSSGLLHPQELLLEAGIVSTEEGEAAGESSSLSTVSAAAGTNAQSATDAALALGTQQQGFAGSVSSIHASSVPVEMATRNPVVIPEEADTSSSTGMALLASLKRLLSRGRIVTPSIAPPPIDLEQGATAGPSHLPPSLERTTAA
ncbi:unnamed protein product [Sphagnum troendelagicum]|uniref:RING-type E3 ubiquitin transferase n=1 Tax=Sphagnum troendelagicum TaxID=128251 RepID=A0ABP0TLT2_9BRYO